MSRQLLLHSTNVFVPRRLRDPARSFLGPLSARRRHRCRRRQPAHRSGQRLSAASSLAATATAVPGSQEKRLTSHPRRVHSRSSQGRTGSQHSPELPPGPPMRQSTVHPERVWGGPFSWLPGTAAAVAAMAEAAESYRPERWTGRRRLRRRCAAAVATVPQVCSKKISVQ